MHFMYSLFLTELIFSNLDGINLAQKDYNKRIKKLSPL